MVRFGQALNRLLRFICATMETSQATTSATSRYKPGSRHAASYIPSELCFYSKLLDATYKASQISDLSEETIRELISEAADVMASVEATRDHAEAQIQIGALVDLDWLKRVRTRYNKVSNFKKLLLKELDVRQGLEGRKSAVRAIKKEKAKLDAHNEHQKRIKDREFQKRKFFYGLVQEKLGIEAFEAMMQRAEEMASTLVPLH
jgi:hypothetical protein